jgi:TRAP-type C4-dicarboxylate transport system permease small subunit
MKNNFKKYLSCLLSLFILLIPFFLFAYNSGTSIKNPLGENNTEVKDILGRIMNLVSLVGGFVVVFFIIYSGYKFVVAGDSDSDRTKAKDIFYSTVIGGAILLGADIIARVVVNTVNCTTKGTC